MLDFIPASLHASIREGTNTDDLTAYFQAAAASSKSISAIVTTGTLGVVYVPNGRYHVMKVGIQGVIIRGQSKEGTLVRAYSIGSPADFLFDAMLDVDGVTPNTFGGGWLENISLDGRIPDGTVSARSGVRTYGGGCFMHAVRVDRCDTGFAIGLPIWSVVSNCYAVECNRGFFTFHNTPNDNDNSTLFASCWADRCTSYGFHISQLLYSSFVNCVSQFAGLRNFFVEGDLNGPPAVYSLQFIGCATEGTGVPFYIRKGREISIDNPRIISPSAIVNYITFDDSTGSIRDFSTVSTPGGRKYHLFIDNHAGGTGSIVLLGDGDITTPTATLIYVSAFGPRINGRRAAFLGGGSETLGTLAANVDNLTASVDTTLLRLTSPGGGCSITGLASGTSVMGDRQRIVLKNLSTSDPITLVHESTSSTAANRFTFAAGVDKVIPGFGSVELEYDLTAQRWFNLN